MKKLLMITFTLVSISIFSQSIFLSGGKGRGKEKPCNTEADITINLLQSPNVSTTSDRNPVYNYFQPKDKNIFKGQKNSTPSVNHSQSKSNNHCIVRVEALGCSSFKSRSTIWKGDGEGRCTVKVPSDGKFRIEIMLYESYGPYYNNHSSEKYASVWFFKHDYLFPHSIYVSSDQWKFRKIIKYGTK